MKYINIRKDELWTSDSSAVLDTKTGQWMPARPELCPMNLKEWFIHTILGKHFTFGQPYCVACGYAEDIPLTRSKRKTS